MSAFPLALEIAALVALVVGVAVVLVVGTRQAQADKGPASHPGDFVARVGAGVGKGGKDGDAGESGYAFRRPDESTEEFHARVARASEPPPRS